MKDIFDTILLCKKCGRKMKKGLIIKNGLTLRYAYCPKCKEKLWHPLDLSEYKKFNDIKRREFKVKLRIVGNSYAITLPKEIINFIKDVEKELNIKKKPQVKLVFDEIGKLNLIFEEIENKIKKILNI